MTAEALLRAAIVPVTPFVQNCSPVRRTKTMRGTLVDPGRSRHPGARMLLARWTASGKFGLREIPRGFGLIRELLRSRMQS